MNGYEPMCAPAPAHAAADTDLPPTHSQRELSKTPMEQTGPLRDPKMLHKTVVWPAARTDDDQLPRAVNRSATTSKKQIRTNGLVATAWFLLRQAVRCTADDTAGKEHSCDEPKLS
jgi:hypothetical protein